MTHNKLPNTLAFLSHFFFFLAFFEIKIVGEKKNDSTLLGYSS